MTHVLLVEDDQWLGECYSAWLSKSGHTVHWSLDAQQALDAIDHRRPDVIVLDLFLPFSNGVQFLHVLAAHSDTTHIPVIVCSTALPTDVDWKPYGVRQALDKTTLTPRQLTAAVGEAVYANAPH